MSTVVSTDYEAHALWWLDRAEARWEDMRMSRFGYGTNPPKGMFEYDQWTGAKIVRTDRPLSDEIGYWLAMHELGHIMRGHHLDTFVAMLYGFNADVTLRAEAEAWEWAFDNAIVPPSEEALAMAQDAFGTYVRDFGRLHPDMLHPYLQEV